MLLPFAVTVIESYSSTVFPIVCLRGIYVSKFTLNEPKHKIFEAGYEESEVDLRVEFELQADGKWYVVDCYTGWYGYDLPIGELKQTIQNVKEENAAFKELHP